MAVSPSFAAFLLQQLHLVPELTSRRMFGGLSFYSSGRIFGVADNDTLYFRIDSRIKPVFEALGMPAWDPMGNGGTVRYMQVPASWLEDPDLLARQAAASAATA